MAGRTSAQLCANRFCPGSLTTVRQCHSAIEKGAKNQNEMKKKLKGVRIFSVVGSFWVFLGSIGSRARSHQHIPHFFFSVASLTHKEKARNRYVYTKTAAETNQKEVDVVDVVVGDGTGGHQTISLEFLWTLIPSCGRLYLRANKTTTTTTTTVPSSRHIITSRQRKKKNQTKTGRNNRREQSNCDDYSTVEKYPQNDGNSK